MDTDRGDMKCLSLMNAGDGELEGDFAGDVFKDFTVSKADFDWGTGFSDKTKIGHQCLINKV